MNQGDGKNRTGRNTPAEAGGGAGKEPPGQTPAATGQTAGGTTGQNRPQAASPITSERAARREVEPPAGWGRFLVAPRPLGLLPGGVPPVEFPVLMALLEEDEHVQVLRQLRPARSRGLGAIAEPHPACPPVAVVAMPPERAAALAANPQVVVEADQPLLYPVTNPLAPAVAAADPALAVPTNEPTTMTVKVIGTEGDPVPGAHVWAIGTTTPAHAVTDASGTARLTLAADTPQTLHALYVRPTGGYWPTRLDNAHLPQDQKAETVVRLRSLADTFEGFPGTPVVGWGTQAMRLTQLPPTFRGHGVKIALLDSGVSTQHPDLKDAVTDGYDFTTGSEHGWDKDATGHGTWCAGIIAAADNQTGITGIAADAHLHALKLYPHGRTSHLLEALDWCTDHQIDIAQANLATPAPSQLLAWKILDTRAAGTTLIAPAGDTGTTCAFPAALPTVISVGALAHAGTTPDLPAPGIWSGPYTPDFTPLGADLAAPGTAILTTSVDGDYTIADGTALAATHLTALAALLLAHHDQLRATTMTGRTGARVDHLTTLLRVSCRPVPGTDPARTGAGLPDAPSALGTDTGWTTGARGLSWPPAAQYASYAAPRT